MAHPRAGPSLAQPRPAARRFPTVSRKTPRRPIASIACVTLALSAGCGPAAEAPPVARRPNVLLIVLDTTRGDRCSVGGYGRPTTPALERLAADGVVYLDAWSPSPWTPPSHATLFTGLRPENHGLNANSRPHLLDDSVTLAERLRDVGYRTAAFSNNPAIRPATGLLQGFDHVVEVYERPVQEYPSARITHDLVENWLARGAGDEAPFFVFINHIEPHFPYTPPDPGLFAFVDASPLEIQRARALDYPAPFSHSLGEVVLPEETVGLLSDLYDAEIWNVDRLVGQLLERLENGGVLDDTVVIVTSDHGESLGEHGLLDHMFSLHRTLLHVPLVVRAPGAMARGGVVTETVRLEDVPATVLDLCGLPAVPDADGVSLRLCSGRPRLARAMAGRPSHLLEVGRRFHPDLDMARWNRAIWSTYDGRYHLIEYEDGEVQFYEPAVDPLEETDLSPLLPDEVTRLRKRRRGS